MEITYNINKSTEKNICHHLFKCDNNFIAQLSQRVDVQHFSRKIFEKSVTFEAWENGILIGLVSAYFNDVENRFGYINNVSIIKKDMGKGIANELLDMSIKYAVEHNFKEIKLEVSKNNFVAMKLYKKKGFYISKNEKDLFIMKLELG
ncbi:MAG: GNAT family N-acetyltransferase [Clostridium botulinum]|nr:GNAT family N-acetyltransferase [Clostridium botulinum]